MRRKLFSFLFSLIFSSGAASACPDLTAFYADENSDWPELAEQLASLMPECLQSAEFFALFGAAQLNSGAYAEALESLERALLLEPANGAAQIDYAEALFQQGQIFPALELNGLLMQRNDLPASLLPLLQGRQQSWRSLTRQHGFQADFLAGYDTNLNGAPDPGQITLTLSGEPVVLNLNPEFRPNSGPYLNVRLGSRYRQLAPDHQHNWTNQLRGRLSEDTDSDLLQFDSRYSFIKPNAEHNWQLDAGLSNLFFGGNILYTATEGRFRYSGQNGGSCRPYAAIAVQHQLFHNQSHLNAIESKATGGISCPLEFPNNQQVISAEFSLLSNSAIKSRRTGGNRGGWQFNADWQYFLPNSVLSAQINHTELQDREDYSPLLAGGAERWLNRSYLLIQYQKPLSYLGENTSLMVNLFHQRQRSNIELFRSIDSTFEVGISMTF